MGKSIVVISGGLGTPSSSSLLGSRIGQDIADQLASAGVQTHVRNVELREHASDITNNMLTGFAAPGLQDVIDAVTEADVLVAVTRCSRPRSPACSSLSLMSWTLNP